MRAASAITDSASSVPKDPSPHSKRNWAMQNVPLTSALTASLAESLSNGPVFHVPMHSKLRQKGK